MTDVAEVGNSFAVSPQFPQHQANPRVLALSFPTLYKGFLQLYTENNHLLLRIFRNNSEIHAHSFIDNNFTGSSSDGLDRSRLTSRWFLKRERVPWSIAEGLPINARLAMLHARTWVRKVQRSPLFGAP
jgi:hypothetical protein